MNNFIRIGNSYYNVNGINQIAFKILESSLEDKELYFIVVNYNEIPVDKENYNRIVKQFREIIGDENIYE